MGPAPMMATRLVGSSDAAMAMMFDDARRARCEWFVGGVRSRVGVGDAILHDFGDFRSRRISLRVYKVGGVKRRSLVENQLP